MAIPVEVSVRERNRCGRPAALADSRFAFHSDVKKRIIAEIKRDLTNHPVLEIEKHLSS